MTYKETLLFIAKCLTISFEKKNLKEVRQEIKYTKIDWNKVVQISTKHYVFPALYCHLKQANLLSELPEYLVKFMKDITAENRSRNQQIISQAIKINDLLLANGITPIFLKGTAFLVEELYQDSAERMVGDIDLLVSKKAYQKAIQVLKADAYQLVHPNSISSELSKHYPRLVKKGQISAVEIHQEMTLKKHTAIFNYDYIQPTLIHEKGFFVMSYPHQLLHTIINKQLNDHGYRYKNIALRNYYDLLLLSYKAVPLKSISLLPSIKKQLNSFLSNAFYIFNKPNSITFQKSKHAKKHTQSTISSLEKPRLQNLKNRCITIQLSTTARMMILCKALYQKKYFLFVLGKITDINWCKRKLLGS